MRQGHRQPIKTGRDSNRHHPAAEGQQPRPSVRSAPTSPHYYHQHDPRLFQHQQQHQQAYQQHQEALLRQQQQQQEAYQQQQEARLRHQHQQRAEAAAHAMPVSAGRKAHGASAAAQAGSYGPHPAAAGTSKTPSSAKPRKPQLSPDAAATRIQTAWRSARLARHKPALKQLATAASQLRQYTAQLQEVLRNQPGVPLSQKQYLEMSEPVMKVLFALDAVTCGSAVELRSKRKDLTMRANQLLDSISAAHKAPPNPAAAAAAAAAKGGGSSGRGAGAQPAAAPAAQQERQAKPKKHWFRRGN